MKGPFTFVLVHGAFFGGWCWRKVADRLAAHGHRVFAPTLTGLGERAHLSVPGLSRKVWINDVCNTILFEELVGIVLVGHSLGGSTITGVADRIPERIRRLIYLDAIVVQPGESILESMSSADVGKRREWLDEAADSRLPVPSLAEFASSMGMRDRENIAWMGRHLTPQPSAAHTEKWHLLHRLGNGVPTSFVVCTEPAYPPLRRAREIAMQQPGWEIVELAACHNAVIEHARATSDLLLGLASL